MPNEPVKCPNCGSGDVEQLGVDSYECEHCQTDFRWVSPTKVTVAHEHKLCTCGRVAVAFCCRCGQGLCLTHGDPGSRDPTDMSSEQLRFAMAKRVFHHKLKYYLDFRQSTSWRSSVYTECMDKHRIPEDREAIMCARCVGECDRALGAVEEQLRQAAIQGQVCGECSSDHIQGRCIICGVGVCPNHGVVCETCHQLVCKEHVAKSGPIVITPGTWWHRATYTHGNTRQCTKCSESEKLHLPERLTRASPWFELRKKLGLQK
jgi:hypothetical protein